MCDAQSVAVADGAKLRQRMGELGYSKKPLRLNLQRQYLIKEYIDLHGGYGPNATPRVSFVFRTLLHDFFFYRRFVRSCFALLMQKILMGIGISFFFAGAFSMAQKKIWSKKVCSIVCRLLMCVARARECRQREAVHIHAGAHCGRASASREGEHESSLDS